MSYPVAAMSGESIVRFIVPDDRNLADIRILTNPATTHSTPLSVYKATTLHIMEYVGKWSSG